MKQLKEEFQFNYKKVTVNVKKLGEVWCAVSGETAKSLKIEFCEGVHVGKILNQEGKFLAWLPKSAIKEIDVNSILTELKKCDSFYDFLIFIKEFDGLELQMDGFWSWLEYKGEEIEGTAKERFVNSSELYVLLQIAGL